MTRKQYGDTMRGSARGRVSHVLCMFVANKITIIERKRQNNICEHVSY